MLLFYWFTFLPEILKDTFWERFWERLYCHAPLSLFGLVST